VQTESDALRKKYNADYYTRYNLKNMFGKPVGERPYFYNFWNRSVTSRLKEGSSVLELGCGGGYFLSRLEKKYDVYAMDISFDALQMSREKVQTAYYYQADAERLPFTDNSLDCIIGMDVVEHLLQPEMFMSEVSRVLAPGGLLIFSTPNPQSLGAIRKAKREDVADDVWENLMMVWHGWRDETHINIRRIDEWRKLAAMHGFQKERDGSDFWWDTQYFPGVVPRIVEKLLFNGTNQVITFLFGFLPWKRGENYYYIGRKAV